MHLLRGTAKFLLCLNILQVSCESNKTFKGCAFEELPEHHSIEPESIPLHIEVDILIIGLRKGSGSGDFFGVDAESVNMYSVVGLFKHFTFTRRKKISESQ